MSGTLSQVKQALQDIFHSCAVRANTVSGVIQRQRVFTAVSLAHTFVLSLLKNPLANAEDFSAMSCDCGTPPVRILSGKPVRSLDNVFGGFFSSQDSCVSSGAYLCRVSTRNGIREAMRSNSNRSMESPLFCLVGWRQSARQSITADFQLGGRIPLGSSPAFSFLLRKKLPHE